MKRHSGISKELQLIGKYLSGEASPEEAAAIDSWRAESAENNRTFESVARLWEESAAADKYRKPQNIDHWLNLKKNIKAGPKKPPSLINRNSFKAWKMAAAVLLFLGIAALFYLFLPRSPKVTYDKIVSAKRGLVKDTLRDSSVIILSRHSQLSVQDQFALIGRKVKLDGEAYFSINPFNEKPFIIYTGGIEIVVLGTTFNIKNDPEMVTVSVRSGKVKMQKGSSGIIVKAGSTGIFHKMDKRFVLHSDSINRNIYSYATRELYFNNTSMTEVKEALENAYGINILFKNEGLNHLRINTSFKKQPLDYVAKVISASLGIQYDLKNDTLYFFKKELK